MKYEPNNKLNQFAKQHSLTISQSFLTNKGRHLRHDLPADKVYVETKVESPLEVIYLSYTLFNYTDDELLQIIQNVLTSINRNQKLSQLLDGE